MFNGNSNMTNQEIQEARISKAYQRLLRKRSYTHLADVFDDLEEFIDMCFPQFKEDRENDDTCGSDI